MCYGSLNWLTQSPIQQWVFLSVPEMPQIRSAESWALTQRQGVKNWTSLNFRCSIQAKGRWTKSSQRFFLTLLVYDSRKHFQCWKTGKHCQTPNGGQIISITRDRCSGSCSKGLYKYSSSTKILIFDKGGGNPSEAIAKEKPGRKKKIEHHRFLKSELQPSPPLSSVNCD